MLQPKTLRDKYDWFLVARNPFDRVVSEFHCRYGGVGLPHNALWHRRAIAYADKNNDSNFWFQADDVYSTATFNDYLRHEISAVVASANPGGVVRDSKGLAPERGHYLPQVRYLASGNPKVKVSVLHFENLTAEFDKLMNEYNLTLLVGALGAVHKNAHADHDRFTTADLDTETVHMVREAYMEDFRTFGYNSTAGTWKTR
jgi:hypothetical protein